MSAGPSDSDPLPRRESTLRALATTALAAGAAFGVVTGLLAGGLVGVLVEPSLGFRLGLAVTLAAGALFAIGTWCFARVTARTFEAARPEFAAETLLHDGPANHRRGWEVAGGWLYLTRSSLVFRPHTFNVNTEEWRVPLGEIIAVRPARTLLLFRIGLRVFEGSGTEQRLVVHRPDLWCRWIERARAIPQFRHLNTDLVLKSDGDLTALSATFTARGLHELYLTRGDDGRWYASFEADLVPREPETVIALLLDAVESLPPPLRTVWDGCSLRELDMGYDCGEEPWAFNQGLSAGLLRRIAAAGASLRVTLYRWTDDRQSADGDPAEGQAERPRSEVPREAPEPAAISEHTPAAAASGEDVTPRQFHHLNTDLVLKSDADLTTLAAALTAQGLAESYLTRGDDGRWHAGYAALGGPREPETAISPILDAVESFAPQPRAVWEACSLRELNIRYKCGEEPWAFNQGLSTGLLRRVAAAGASIRITLYRWTGDGGTSDEAPAAD